VPLRSPKLAASAAVAACLLATPLVGSSSGSTSPAPSATNLLRGETRALTASTGAWRAEAGRVALHGRGVLSTETVKRGGWTLTLSGRTTSARPGVVYRGSFSVRAEKTGRAMAPYLFFYDRAGTVLDRVRGEQLSDTTSAWRPVTPVVAIAPPGTVAVALGQYTTGSALREKHLLSRPSVTATTPPRTDVVGPLRTVGNKVLDGNGPIALRGIHRFALEGGVGGSSGKNLTEADLAQAKRWGATMVRVSVSSAYWLRTNCHYDARYKERVDNVVRWLTARKVVALVDLHTNTIGTCGPIGQQVMADRTAIPFWKDVAKRYAGNPLVAFDLYNEPHDISDKVWLQGGVVTSGGAPVEVVGMQDLYDAVRATGAGNLVVVSGNSWANRLPAQRVVGSGIVYGVHAYTCPTAVDSSCSASPYDPTRILRPWVAPSRDVPVAVTEFGWPSQSSGLYVSRVISFAQAHGWGWVAFGWDGTPYSRFSLLSTAGRGATYQPTPSGMPVLAALAAQ
jgi:hypothetical protein